MSTEFAARASHFRLRSPASSTSGLLHGFSDKGVCLEPLLEGRCEAWFDPELAPTEGDLVLVEYTDEWIQRVRESVERSSADYREAWLSTDCVDGEMPRFAAKLYVERAGVPFLLCKDYAIPLDRVGAVRGVCRHVTVDGVPAYGSRDDDRRNRRVFLTAIAVSIVVLAINYLQELP